MSALANSTHLPETPAREANFTLADLVRRIEPVAIRADIQGVRAVIESAIRNHPGFLPARFLVSKEESYARREIYEDPKGRFSILAMVWAPGQGTPLHDHGGLWVVEAVYQGLVNVFNYDSLGVHDGLHQFALSEERLDAPGVSDCRVAPEEHHVLRNTTNEVAVTIHIFGGILERCNMYEPVGGGYRQVQKTMQVD